MKKSFYYLAAAILSTTIACSCGGKGTAAGGKSDNAITNFAVKEVIKTADKNYRLVTDYDTVYMDLYTSIHWPEQLGDADLKVLQDSILYFAYGDTVSTSIDKAIYAYIDDTSIVDGIRESVVVDSIPQGDDRTMAYFGNVTVSLVDLDEYMVTYQVMNSTFLGGAHPMTAICPFTYDLRNGRVLNVDNMFKAEARDSVMPVVINALARQLDVDPMQLEKAGIFTSQLTYPGNPYIANNMLYFHYNPYDIAPYAAGMIDVAVYPYEVASMLKPDVLDLFYLGIH